MKSKRILPWLFSRSIHRKGWKNHRSEGKLALGHSLDGPRGRNQDRMLIDENAGIFAVFDGVGSVKHGSKAAELAKNNLTKLALNIPNMMRGHRHLDQVSAYINSQLFNTYSGSAATTLAGIFQISEGILIFHAGDTRVYRLRGGLLRQLTMDHRAVEPASGKIGITRALGAAKNFSLEILHSSVCDSDVYLICSDGVHDCLTDRQLEMLLNSTSDIQQRGHVLSGFLAQKWLKDDATFILIEAEALLPSPT